MEYATGFEWQYFSNTNGKVETCKITGIAGHTYTGEICYSYVSSGEPDREYSITGKRIVEHIENLEYDKEIWELRQIQKEKERLRSLEKAAKRETFEKYLATLTLMQAGKARKTLEKMYNFVDLGVKTRFELIEILVKNNKAIYKEYTITHKPTREEKWSGDRRTREAWGLGGYDDNVITKTGLKYSEWLKENA